MEHLEKEKVWGASLGVMQPSCDLLIAGLRTVLDEIRDGMEAYECSCKERGCDYANDPTYRRYHQLYCKVGGIYYCMQGSVGLLSGLVLDLLSDIDI